MSQELKPLNCPFCNGEAKFDKTVYKEVGVIRCQKCRASNGIVTQEHTAIKAWNQRATPGLDRNKLSRFIESMLPEDYYTLNSLVLADAIIAAEKELK